MRRNPVLYTILCHSDISHICDLFRYIYSPDDIFLFHADSKSNINLIKAIEIIELQFENVYILESQLCSWGGYSLVEVLLQAIDRSLSIDNNWSHLILLSEHHIPLYSSEEIFYRLTPGVSWIDASRVNEMPVGGRDDVRQRFSMYYQELPGVGPFATHPRIVPSEVWDQLYHGSQWVILARNACERLSKERINYKDIMDLFRSSALPDETAIPTLLLGTALGRNLHIVLQNSTYLAWPHLGGLPGMLFTDANLNAARNKDFLFIRKRPTELSNDLLDRLELNSRISASIFASVIKQEEISEDFIISLRSKNIYRLITESFSGLDIKNIALEAHGICPTFYMRITQKTEENNKVFINIVSEDLKNFKLVLVTYDNLLQSKLEKSGIVMSMIRARVHDLAYNMEIFLPNLPLNEIIYCPNNEFIDIINNIRRSIYFINYIEI